MKTISLETAVVITKRSKRTWWRRIAEGLVTRLENDTRGRTRLALHEVAPHICIFVDAEDMALILKADTGDAEAQNDVGQLFAQAGRGEIAFFWWTAAAAQNNPDAMQNLGGLYVSGKGVGKDENIGIMWIAKAASFGHPIALSQMAHLRPLGK